ncbi:hypothetical protein LTR16_007784, partial [Cryomyces antarcticus]
MLKSDILDRRGRSVVAEEVVDGASPSLCIEGSTLDRERVHRDFLVASVMDVWIGGRPTIFLRLPNPNDRSPTSMALVTYGTLFMG